MEDFKLVPNRILQLKKGMRGLTVGENLHDVFNDLLRLKECSIQRRAGSIFYCKIDVLTDKILILEDMAKGPNNPECHWKREEEQYGDDSWATQCGDKHIFFSGDPLDNNHKFCPYCGGRIIFEEKEQ